MLIGLIARVLDEKLKREQKEKSLPSMQTPSGSSRKRACGN
jgi:hypothetical protein